MQYTIIIIIIIIIIICNIYLEGCLRASHSNWNLSLGAVAPPTPRSVACCSAVFHKCLLYDFWNCTGTCEVAYLARTVNNSYPTCACLSVLYYKDIKGTRYNRKSVVCVSIIEGGSKAITFRPAVHILVLRTVTTGDVDLWNIFVNEPVEIFLGRISFPQLCCNDSNSVTWPQWLSL